MRDLAGPPYLRVYEGSKPEAGASTVTLGNPTSSGKLHTLILREAITSRLKSALSRLVFGPKEPEALWLRLNSKGEVVRTHLHLVPKD
jgi:hypothetical protein